MSADKLFETIIATTYTKAEIYRRIRLLREYLEEKFYGKEKAVDFAAFLNKKGISKSDYEVMMSWPEDMLTSFEKSNAYDLIDGLVATIKARPVVTLYIPFDPPPAETAKLGSWFRKTVHVHVIIDLHVDLTTFGGCAFAYEGIYHDYSLGYYMQKHRDEIRGLITNYVTESKKE
jgi:hypothetical protein